MESNGFMYDDFAHHNVNQIVWILAEEGACYMRPFARRPPQFGQIPQDFGASLPPDIPDGWIQLVIWKLRAKSRTSVGSHNRKEENHQSYIWRLVHIVLIIWTWRQKQLWLGEPSKTTQQIFPLMGGYPPSLLKTAIFGQKYVDFSPFWLIFLGKFSAIFDNEGGRGVTPISAKGFFG